ncbi:MAG TPA: hypothetical protein PKE55_08805 [Kiritimatiellia bacterium]|nr:hypothetical protein [Kiritimatiellia bacterium]
MKRILASFSALLLTSAVASAVMLGQGTQALRLSGFFDPDTVAGTRFDLEVGYGYFVVDYLEIGGSVGIYTDSIVDTYILRGYTEYNFDTATPIVPFAGLALSLYNSDVKFADTKESSSAAAIKLYGGSKYFMTQNLAITGTAGFEVATDDVFPQKRSVSNTDFRIELGLRYYF